MLLKVPHEIDDVLWEAPLELIVQQQHQYQQQRRNVGLTNIETFQTETWSPRGGARDEDLVSDREYRPLELPIVSVGRPTAWPLREIYTGNDVSDLMKASLARHDYYLVRLACSYRPKPGETAIETARFEVELLAGAGGAQPIAFDLDPLQVMTETKRNVKVTISPSLKFEKIDAEASLGSVKFGLEYTELQPSISASGVGERQPSWDYRATRGQPVIGAKMMHLIVQAPLGMPAARARLSLNATVSYHGSFLSAWLDPPQQKSDALTVDLWTAAPAPVANLPHGRRR